MKNENYKEISFFLLFSKHTNMNGLRDIYRRILSKTSCCSCSCYDECKNNNSRETDEEKNEKKQKQREDAEILRFKMNIIASRSTDALIQETFRNIPKRKPKNTVHPSIGVRPAAACLS
jgi:hypothetical protein